MNQNEKDQALKQAANQTKPSPTIRTREVNGTQCRNKECDNQNESKYQLTTCRTMAAFHLLSRGIVETSSGYSTQVLTARQGLVERADEFVLLNKKRVQTQKFQISEISVCRIALDLKRCAPQRDTQEEPTDCEMRYTGLVEECIQEFKDPIHQRC
jgi:hypothetical protein